MKRNLCFILLVFTIILCVSSCDLIPGLSGNGGTGENGENEGGNENGGNENGGNENGGNEGGNENVDPTVESLRITGHKTSLAFGEGLTFDELQVTAEMSDGSEKVLSSNEFEKHRL